MNVLSFHTVQSESFGLISGMCKINFISLLSFPNSCCLLNIRTSCFSVYCLICMSKMLVVGIEDTEFRSANQFPVFEAVPVVPVAYLEVSLASPTRLALRKRQKRPLAAS